MKVLQLFVYALLLHGFSAFPQGTPGKIDMSYFMQPGNELVIDYSYLTNGELKIRYQYKDPLLLSVYFIAWESEKSKKYFKNQLITTACNDKDCIFSLSLDSLSGENYNTLIFRDEASQQELVFPIKTDMPVRSPLILTDGSANWLPDRYLQSGTRVSTQTADNSAIIYAYYYSTPFKPAGPPTGLKKNQESVIYPDSTFTLLSHTSFNLEKEGFYLLQTDTNSINAYTFRVYSSPYPDYKTVDQHINAMQYLTSREEWETLQRSEASKNDFEKMWLSMAGSETKAKEGIRYYFRGIEQSNRRFTSHTDGWKTDKGMIYTIFGPPTHMYIKGHNEIWQYEGTQNHNSLEFTFLYYPIIFSQYHSILQRDKAYSLPWNRTVDRLRRGNPNYE